MYENTVDEFQVIYFKTVAVKCFQIDFCQSHPTY